MNKFQMFLCLIYYGSLLIVFAYLAIDFYNDWREAVFKIFCGLLAGGLLGCPYWLFWPIAAWLALEDTNHWSIKSKAEVRGE